jgi:hypothetical protein
MTEEDENAVIFREVQKFGRWLRWVLVFSMPVTGAVVVFAGAIEGVITEPSFIFASVAWILGMVGIMAFFLALKLETEVRPDGLYVRFFPYHTRYKKFTGQDLGQYYARQYRPLREYGGWGIRFGPKGWAYNVSGNGGVQLILRSGKKLLIGSQRAQELAEAINSIMTTT